MTGGAEETLSAKKRSRPTRTRRSRFSPRGVGAAGGRQWTSALSLTLDCMSINR